jgi:hypothetical protein
MGQHTGHVTVTGESFREAEIAHLSVDGDGVKLTADGDAMVLVLTGQPIDEPVVGRGPFVMNTEAEIQQTMRDFQTGRFGRMASSA